MNYYNYYTEIEDTFVRRRGKHLLLSPIDWAMIESWQERGVPLHVVLRGIEAVFDNFDKNPGPRTIKGLLFCREEIEAKYLEWTASRVGRSEEIAAEKADKQFTLESIAGHIENAVGCLRNLTGKELREDADRAAHRLEELKNDLSDDFEAVDKSLCDIEHFLDVALLKHFDKNRLKIIEKETAAVLREYKSGMEKEVFEQTFTIMLLKRLREEANIPRLGLFYL